MASPQTKNGYTKIANEIMDQFVKTRIPGTARQVLDYILRKTYGWNKKEDQISLSQFVESTGLSKVAVCKSINTLLNMNIITKKGNAESLFTKKGNDVAVTYGINKDYEKWNTLPKKVTLPKKEKYVTQKGNNTLPNWGTTKESIKDNNTKDILFIDFWNIYPKKVGKGAAKKSWDKIKRPTEVLGKIKTALEWQVKSEQWQKDNGQYIPNPSTYLNQVRWEDELPTNNSTGAAGSIGKCPQCGRSSITLFDNGLCRDCSRGD